MKNILFKSLSAVFVLGMFATSAQALCLCSNGHLVCTESDKSKEGNPCYKEDSIKPEGLSFNDKKDNKAFICASNDIKQPFKIIK